MLLRCSLVGDLRRPDGDLRGLGSHGPCRDRFRIPAVAARSRQRSKRCCALVLCICGGHDSFHGLGLLHLRHGSTRNGDARGQCAFRSYILLVAVPAHDGVCDTAGSDSTAQRRHRLVLAIPRWLYSLCLFAHADEACGCHLVSDFTPDFPAVSWTSSGIAVVLVASSFPLGNVDRAANDDCLLGCPLVRSSRETLQLLRGVQRKA
mmetsp:Transcript_42620/g.77426  ORF Transcript_42620/g.77426 Transcript_42620/m.77426 type:complete len:206 (+) Transcript_42620:145-762(+)